MVGNRRQTPVLHVKVQHFVDRSIHPDLLYMDECDTKFKSKELSGLNLTDYMWHWQMRHDQGIDTHRDTNTSLWGVINTGPVYLTPKPVPPPTCFSKFAKFIHHFPVQLNLCLPFYSLSLFLSLQDVYTESLEEKVHMRRMNKPSKSHMTGMITYHILCS